jgi:plastocyanin/sugar lactone lactonase YvrE
MARSPGFPISEASDIVAAVSRWTWLLLVIALWPLRVAAQSSTHVEVYASGLVNPKALAFGADGTLYVAESGKPGEVMVPLPVNFGGTGPVGTNARVSRIPAGGQRQDLVTGLPNVGLYGGIEMLGATGVAFLGGTLYELAAGHITVSPTLSRVTPDGTLQPVADIGAFNRLHPVPGDNGDAVPMGNPYDLVVLGNNLYITDGNYNRVLKVTPDGSVSLLTDFGGDPTSVGAAAGPDGNLYVAQFGVAPYTPGTGRVDRVTPDGTVTSGAVTGLTTPIDVAFAPDGTMYVLQYAAQFNADRLRYVPGGGEVRRVNADGSTSAVVTGLMFPSGMTFGPDGALYVSNYGNESNDGQGQVLRVTLGSQVVVGPSVAAPDESKSYALAQPTPVGQASASTEVVGTVDFIEPTDPMQWGFEPKSMTVQVGQAIKFTNTGKIAHTATQSQGAFDTGFLKNNESATLTFDTPGTFAYFCQPHPWMQGTIVVEGQARAGSAAASAPISGTAEEDAPPPSIGVGRAVIFAIIIVGLVFAVAFAATRSKRGGNART